MKKGFAPVLLLICGLIVTVVVVGTFYLFKPNRDESLPKKSLSPSPVLTPESSSIQEPQQLSKDPKIAAFMRYGDVWVKDFKANKEQKISKTSGVEGPRFSADGKYLYYFQIVHAASGFPRYSVYVSDRQGKSEKELSRSANYFASKPKWSSDGIYLGVVLFGNDIPGGPNYSEEAFIYDTGLEKEMAIGKVTRRDLSSYEYTLTTSCDQLPTQYTNFCKEYASYLKVPKKHESSDYKSAEYQNSKYTKPNYQLIRSEKLENGLILLEYYTGEPQNPESQWGEGGGSFIPGYDEGVRMTYTVLLDEINNKVIEEISPAIDSDFIF